MWKHVAGSVQSHTSASAGNCATNYQSQFLLVLACLRKIHSRVRSGVTRSLWSGPSFHLLFNIDLQVAAAVGARGLDRKDTIESRPSMNHFYLKRGAPCKTDLLFFLVYLCLVRVHFSTRRATSLVPIHLVGSEKPNAVGEREMNARTARKSFHRSSIVGV